MTTESERTDLRRTATILAGIAGLALALAYAGLGLVYMLPGEDGFNRAGHRFGNDFAGLYAAAALAAEGTPEQAYDEAMHRAAAERLTGAAAADLPWFYPPVLLLALEPFAALSYPSAVLAWCLLSLMALMVCGFVLGLQPRLVVLFMLMPACVSGLLAGQTTVLLAAFLGLGIALLRAHPYAAGAILGLLVFKPHLAILVPIALAAGSHWRAIAGMACSAGLSIGVSIAHHGMPAWLEFLGALPRANVYLKSGQAPWSKMVTVYAALREAGLSDTAATIAQLSVAGAAVLVLIWICRRSRCVGLQGAALSVTVLLTTPYAFFYDTAVLAPLAAWLWIMAWPRSWHVGEQLALMLLWVAPILFWQIAALTNWQLWPLLLGSLLFLIARRAATEGAMDRHDGREDRA